MTDPIVFGYGSLVNKRTLPNPLAPAALPGYRRTWQATATRDVAFLSIRSAPGSTIEGSSAKIIGGDFSSLNKREAGYSPILAQSSIGPVITYQVPQENHVPRDNHHLLLSYIDVVVQGFWDMYGLDGVDRFWDTTDGWDIPIIDDRRAPRYPRAQSLSSQQIDAVDSGLANLSAVIE